MVPAVMSAFSTFLTSRFWSLIQMSTLSVVTPAWVSCCLSWSSWLLQVGGSRGEVGDVDRAGVVRGVLAADGGLARLLHVAGGQQELHRLVRRGVAQLVLQVRAGAAGEPAEVVVAVAQPVSAAAGLGGEGVAHVRVVRVRQERAPST